MDTSPSAPRLCYGFQRYQQWSSSGSDDSDLSYMSSPGTLSPVPSVDSSLSPASSACYSYVQQRQNTESTPKAQAANTGDYPDGKLLERASSTSMSGAGKRTKTARGGARGPCRVARVRSKQRESASEKEKLRMRDLTKALNHLRTYLPPSVAPAGQSLTKIETLRLTIRYISDLSEQLGLSDEVLERWSHRRRRQEEEKGDDCCYSSEISSPDTLNGSGGASYFQCGATAVGCVWTQSQSLGLGLDTSQYHHHLHHQSQPAVSSGSCGFGADLCQYSGQYSQETQADIFGSNMESGDLLLPSATLPISCQMYGKDCSPVAPRDYWGLNRKLSYNHHYQS